MNILFSKYDPLFTKEEINNNKKQDKTKTRLLNVVK